MVDYSVVIDEIIKGQTVFLNENIFSVDYLPNELPGRQDQLQELIEMFREVILHPNKFHQEIVIQGPTGSGKTTLIRYFLRSFSHFLRKDFANRFEFVQINCRKMNRPLPIISTIIHRLDPMCSIRGFSTDELFQQLIQRYSSVKTHLLLVLDEFDFLLKENTGKKILYSLLRFYDDNSTIPMKLSLILITKQNNLKEITDNSILSTILGKIILLPAYSFLEIKKILEDRVRLGLKSNVINEDLINQLSIISAENGGDARIAIENLWRVGKKADQLKKDSITNEHLELSFHNTFKFFRNDINEPNLSDHEEIILEALNEILEKSKLSYVPMGQIKNHYINLCKTKGAEPRGHTQIWKFINRLQEKGLISTEVGAYPNSKGRTTLIRIQSQMNK